MENKHPYLEDTSWEKHSSFGSIQWNRCTTTGMSDLFGTSMQHDNIISLTISEAESTRSLNKTKYFPVKKIIEVNMSPNQFSEFITNPNNGSGVPCTIRFRQDIGKIDGMLIKSQRLQYENDFKNKLNDIGKTFDILKNTLDDIKITQKDKQKLSSAIFEVSRIINDEIPFIQKSFNEQIDNSVNEAKLAVEAFIEEKNNNIKLLE